jgi:hypothetical protein
MEPQNERQHQQQQRQSENNQTTTFGFDPLSLDTLELTAFVLGLFRKEVTTDELAGRLARNYSLAGAYLRLFYDWEWIDKQGDKWALTELGIESLLRFQSRAYEQEG